MDNSEYSYKYTFCKKKFTISIPNAEYPKGKEYQNIDCSWCCEENVTEMTSGIITTHKIDTKGGIVQ